MADATWPVGLDTYLSVVGFKEIPGKNTISQPMAYGPPKKRKRTTTTPTQITGTMLMTYDELAIFDSFYNDTLQSGVLTFDGLPHPRTRATDVTWQFSGEEPPEYTPEGSLTFRVSMRLQILP